MEEKLKAAQLELHSETARIAWRDLQRFFAQGKVLQVESGVDLVLTAAYFSIDAADQIKSLLDSDDLYPVPDSVAREWYDADQELWSVVVAPFVLVQNADNNSLDQPG